LHWRLGGGGKAYFEEKSENDGHDIEDDRGGHGGTGGFAPGFNGQNEEAKDGGENDAVRNKDVGGADLIFDEGKEAENSAELRRVATDEKPRNVPIAADAEQDEEDGEFEDGKDDAFDH